MAGLRDCLLYAGLAIQSLEHLTWPERPTQGIPDAAMVNAPVLHLLLQGFQLRLYDDLREQAFSVWRTAALEKEATAIRTRATCHNM